MELAIEKIKGVIRQKSRFLPDGVLFLDLLVLLLLIGLACFYIVYPEGDQVEHLYASYRVSLGEVPYRDFFEHHNPLLWYIMAPLLWAMERNIEVLGVACYLTFLFFVLGLFFIYKIMTDFMESGRVAAFFAIIVLLVPGVFLYYIYFKPDNWMFTALSGGSYFYFKYLRYRLRRDLVSSYLFFIASFLLTQKALAFYPVIGVASLMALYKKEMRWSDFLVAAGVALALLAGCGVYFSLHGGLKHYFDLNFLFNSKMAELVGSRGISKPWLMAKLVFGIGLVSVICLWRQENRYFRFWSFMFLITWVMKIFYFSPHVYYWYEAYYFAVPISALGIIRIIGNRQLVLWLVVLELQVYVGLMAYYIHNDVVYKPKRIIPSETEFVVLNTNRCDSVLMPGWGNVVIFNKILGYYNFLYGQMDVMGAKLKIHDVEDLNELIKKYRPKLLLVNMVYERYPEKEGAEIVVHKPDMALIEKLYMPTARVSDKGGFDFKTLSVKELGYKRGLWKLKPEYRQKNCHYDALSKRWEYDKD